MRWPTTLLLLVTAAGRLAAADEAGELFRAMEAKVARAKALECAFEATTAGSPKLKVSVKGFLALAEGNRCYAEVSGDGDGKAFEAVFASDGQKMRWVRDGTAEGPQDTPKQLADTVRAMVTRSGVLVPLFAASDPAAKELTIDERYKVTDLALDKGEKVGDREVRVVRYALYVRGAKEPLAARVWLDATTNLPLKREMTATVGKDTITLTETCQKLTLAPKVDAKRFELPDK